MPHYIMLTIDVEDWFQVENLRSCCPVSSWSSYELRVERNVHRILDLFEEISGQPFGGDNKATESCKSCQESIRQDQQDKQGMSSGSNPFSQFRQEPEKKPGRPRKSCLKGFVDNGDGQRTTDFGERLTDNGERITAAGERITDNGEQRKLHATFFVLGWIAERLPNLVREIQARGHEVASHGFGHELCSQSSIEDLREDLSRSKKLVEDIIGERIYGYRAPSFSISDDILDTISEAGYLYDSSYNSFAMHGRYGKISLNGHERRGIGYRLSEGFYELPISDLTLKKPFSSRLSALGSDQNKDSFVLPWGGGAYFRLIPSRIFRKGVRRILSEQGAYLFYMHPWEIDPEQPRVNRIFYFDAFRHYTNLKKTYSKLASLLEGFKNCRFASCSQYLQEVTGNFNTAEPCENRI